MNKTQPESTVNTVYIKAMQCGRLSVLFLFGVQRSSVRRERWCDSLPAVWWPDDVRGPTVKQPHRHLGKKQHHN